MSIRTMATTAVLICMVAVQVEPAAGQATGIPPVARSVDREASLQHADGRSFVRLDARAGYGLAILAGPAFTEGVLELDVRGEDVQGASFVGLAFHVQDDTTYEAVYVRPFNFRTPNPERRLRAVQYVSHPAYPWHRLREESPGRYEAGVRSAPDPDAWVRLRVVVAGTRVSVFVGETDEPDLTVERLGRHGDGGIGLWVGEGSGGDFARLVVSPP